jgi:hypothetical protein
MLPDRLIATSVSNTSTIQPAQEVMITAPPPIAQWSVLASLTVAAIGWMGRRLWEAWDRKELEESSLNRALVDDLRKSHEQILNDVRDSHAQIRELISLKESITKLAADMNKVIGGQALMIGELAGQLSIIAQKLDKLSFTPGILHSNGYSDAQHHQPGIVSPRMPDHGTNRGQ